ncbi:MAG: DNA mismatch repair protein MutT [uncultured Aureispira sp.]|uniref:8-oxo-dGTP diphosphatase n=1 Tax=uncultured Aureispira sp. TaxID=1331704 RepID=A0A6S6UAA0_9BACT|nr:MAG: DNA mismatch repair protein MutT [uncultured Aureispira sp.]
MKNRMRVTCGVIEKAGKYLIVQRGADTSHAFKWEFPGGKVDPGETEAACMARELKEELDIDVLVEEPLLPIEREETDRIIELLPFRCRIIGGKITLLEHLKMAWIDVYQPIEYDLCIGDYEIVEQLKQ